MCRHPKQNASCLALDGIREKRDDETESKHARERFDEFSPDQRPPCFEEQGSFMAPFPMTEEITHPHSEVSCVGKNLKPHTLRHPPYSATAIPYRWMLQETGQEIARELGLDVCDEQEPDIEWMSTWFQGAHNQRELLETFHSAIEPGQSLCLFYAKDTPLTDDPRKVLIGAGRIKDTGSVEEYRFDDPEGFRACVWDVAVEHTIRPKFEDGFLLPYQQIIEKTRASDEVRRLEEYTAFAPDDRRQEFSYAAEHVTHDGAIGALLSCKSAIEKSLDLVPGSWCKVLDWIDDRLDELWTLRGPYPGLGAAVSAFGMSQGTFIAREISDRINVAEEDPWEELDAVLEDPSVLSERLQEEITPTDQERWTDLKENKEARRDLLELLSRFEITSEQAERFYDKPKRKDVGVDWTDGDLLENPYLLYQEDRFSEEPISLQTVDRGLFLQDGGDEFAADLQSPDPLDPRRVSALLINQLDRRGNQGDTLARQTALVKSIRAASISPDCPVDKDYLNRFEEELSSALEKCTIEVDGQSRSAFQLRRFVETREVIREAIEKRHQGDRHDIEVNWRKVVDAHYGDLSAVPGSNRKTEERARAEKAAVLNELASSRFSVFLGPAGTGKTDVLSLLCQEPNIKKDGVLLLAPTGKARVRMLEATDRAFPAKTLAQFLLQHNRYDPETGRCHRSDKDATAPAATVIVDEASMLTEVQVAALFDAVKNVKRFIFVGDPGQLPPIGAGRPLLDIATHLRPDGIEYKFPRVAPGYTELTVVRRQDGGSRRDVQFGRLFGRQTGGPAEDEVLSLMHRTDDLDHLRFVRWDEADDLRPTLLNVIVDELDLEEIDDSVGFEESLGGTSSNGHVYFNLGNTAEKAESWQVLTPLRGSALGTRSLNRLIQKQFRGGTLDFAQQRKQIKIPRPQGRDEIVYGDKVINIKNKRTDEVYPSDEALNYVANGEVGIMVDHFNTAKSRFSGRPFKVDIEFTSQPGKKYTFYPSDFQGPGREPLRLAYAITAHKSQGSGFDQTILVLPNSRRSLSRELLYTALTRQRERVVILHQGDRTELQQYRSHYYSDVARRVTNLFGTPGLVEIRERLLDATLVHLSRDGNPKRSKSEAVIANELLAEGVDFEYEAPLEGESGGTRYPDFTIEGDDPGELFYWEHCGLLEVPEYRRRWETKKDWYRTQDILPLEEGGGENGTLLVTEDELEGGIDSHAIRDLINRALK